MRRAGQRLWMLIPALAVLSSFPVAPGAAASAMTAPGSHNPAGCTSSHVLLLGSYPSEVSDNLDRAVLDPDQPTVIDGLDFYAGTLSGSPVVIAIAGPSPAVTFATTVLALQHFACTSAVVFSGTAGGGGESGLGDVAVPSAWTSNGGASFSPVNPAALSVAQEIVAAAGTKLETSGPINDGPCLCQGVVQRLHIAPILRTPRVIVGGLGTTYGGESDPCLAAGGMLLGCNPCPPSSGDPLVSVSVPITLGAVTSTEVARDISLEVSDGALVDGARSILARLSPPPPTGLAQTAAGSSYIADDQQTTGAQQAADAYHVPFIAFRGISDTSAVGNLWPFEWLVYQQLAADNAAIAARLWISRWDGH